MATNKDIIERLNCIEQNVSNGQLEEIHQTVKEIKEVLLDPEDGIIVRVNKNDVSSGLALDTSPVRNPLTKSK